MLIHTKQSMAQSVPSIARGKAVNPELRRALDLLRTGQAAALVVAKIDRLARSVLHASEILVAAQQQHWNLVILDLAVDLATPQMLATFAELEREMIFLSARRMPSRLVPAPRSATDAPRLSRPG